MNSQYEESNIKNKIDEERLNEDYEESEYCEFISDYLKYYDNKNNLPFPIYLKDSIGIILQGLSELERLRPDNPVEFFSVYLLQKAKESRCEKK